MALKSFTSIFELKLTQAEYRLLAFLVKYSPHGVASIEIDPVSIAPYYYFKSDVLKRDKFFI